MRRTVRVTVGRTAAALAGSLWLICAVPTPAGAHPLGNFSVNHYFGFSLYPDRIDLLAVTDTAEIPTLQQTAGVETDAERAAWAAARCAETAGRLAVDAPQRLSWTVRSATMAYQPGQAGLRTSRVECRMDASVALADGRTALRIDTGVDTGRVGWHEITARGEGVRLARSSVPETSASDELRSYPADLLSSPRGDRTAELTVEPGGGPGAGAGRHAALPTASGLDRLSGRLAAMVGAARLTVPVGLLAVLLSLVLGAGHALLPGHGKTVMAAYLVGRGGRARDAVTVGATVTVTHTAGVLVLGLCLTSFSALAGDTVLGWLGAVSGALVAAVGAGLLRTAVRRRPSPRRVEERTEARELVGAGAPAPHHDHHDHHHSHDHHHHGHEHSHRHRPFTTGGLVGLGVAGGLVPSPSALVVLLGAVALGRTAFGVALVLAYGLGMAATLTAAGLLLGRLGDRLNALPVLGPLRRLTRHTAPLTAVLVLLVGLGLMVRSLPAVL